jgi:A/G-specific adenine glycosylase
VNQLPIKAKAKKQKSIQYFALLIRNEHNEYIIEQRPDTGLLADLWQFPMIPMNDCSLNEVEDWVYEKYGIIISMQEKKGQLKHVFTHIIWNLEIYVAETTQARAPDAQWKFVHKRDLRAYPFPVSHLNMMNFISAN